MTRCFIAAPWEVIGEHRIADLLASVRNRLRDHSIELDADGVAARRTDCDQVIVSLVTPGEEVMNSGPRYATIDFDCSPPRIRSRGNWPDVEKDILHDHWAANH